MDIFYENHIGERIDLNSENIILQYQEFFNYSWDAVTKNRKITGFKRDSATIPVTVAVTAETEEEYLEIIEGFYQITEKDILAVTPGKLYVDEQYLNCYISGDIKQDAFKGILFQIKNLTLVTDYPFWIKEHPYYFKSSDVTSAKNKRYANKYAYRYANGLNNTYLINEHYEECNFRMNIYGPCVKPSVYIGGYEYHVDVILGAGEYLEIDSAAETATKILTSGVKVNVFHYRSFENSVFHPIQVGRQEVFWDGKFDFDLILFEERSEPKWL